MPAWVKRLLGFTSPLDTSGFGSFEEEEAARLCGAVRALGKDRILSALRRAREEESVQVVETEFKLLGGIFRASLRFNEQKSR